MHCGMVKSPPIYAVQLGPLGNALLFKKKTAKRTNASAHHLEAESQVRPAIPPCLPACHCMTCTNLAAVICFPLAQISMPFMSMLAYTADNDTARKEAADG